MRDKSKNKHVENRRRLLKNMMASSAAVASYNSAPPAWKEPVINAVLLPAHAEATVPSFIDKVEFAYEFQTPGHTDSVQQLAGTLTPGNSPEVHVITPGDTVADGSDANVPDYDTFNLVPNIIVDPTITDTFNLSVNEVVFSGNSTNFDPTTQNAAPDNTNGVIPFTTVSGSVDDAQYIEYSITLTPDNPMFPVFFLQITFDEAPPGSALP